MPVHGVDRWEAGVNNHWWNNDIRQNDNWPKAFGTYEENKGAFWTYSNIDTPTHELVRRWASADAYWSLYHEANDFHEYGLFVFGKHTGRYSDEEHGKRRELIRLEGLRMEGPGDWESWVE